jgi:hypothetical protein
MFQESLDNDLLEGAKKSKFVCFSLLAWYSTFECSRLVSGEAHVS